MKSNQGSYTVKAGDVKLINDAQTLSELGEYAAAEKRYVEVLERSPTCVPALYNYAIVCDFQGRHELSDNLFQRALAVEDEDAYVHYFYGLCLLRRGCWLPGFNHYRWRFYRKVTSTLHDTFPVPFWNGEDLKGRHLLVWTEQGLGDEVLLSNFFNDLRELECKLTVVCSDRIAPVFARSFPDVDFVSKELVLSEVRSFPTVDYQASLSELGKFILPIRKPLTQGWLKADPEYVEYFRKKYGATKDNLVVGISWASMNNRAAEDKTIALRYWEAMFNNPGITFVSLQYGDAKEEVAALGKPLILDSEVDAVGDIQKLAQQIKACDLVITVSNTTAHLAGALGVPVLNMVPKGKGRLWYWLMNKSRSLFYPTMLIHNRGDDINVDVAMLCHHLRKFKLKGRL